MHVCKVECMLYRKGAKGSTGPYPSPGSACKGPRQWEQVPGGHGYEETAGSYRRKGDGYSTPCLPWVDVQHLKQPQYI